MAPGPMAPQDSMRFVGLTVEDLSVAWEYFREHSAEIDEDLRENEAD